MTSREEYSCEIVAQIIGLKKAGFQSKEIVQQIDASERTVQCWVAQLYEEGGEDVPSSKPRSGRPKKTCNHAQTIVKQTLESKVRFTIV